MGVVSTIDENGFTRKRFEDILEGYQDDYKEEFGDQIDLTDNSILTQQIKVRAQQEADLNELAEISFNNLNPDNAFGIALDALCSLSGIQRLTPLATVVPILCRGDDGTQIPKDKTVSKNSGVYSFTLDEDIIINKDACTEIFIEVESVQNTTDYTITITKGASTEIFTYTSDSDALESEILTGLETEINGGSLGITADVVDARLWIYADDLTSVNMLIDIDDTSLLAINEIGLYTTCTCTVLGPIIINANEVTVITEGVSGWNSVINLQVGITGRNRETDDELKLRRNETLQISNCSTDPAIKKTLLDDVTGVTKAIVISNRTDSIVDGQPARTFQAVVVGGGDDDIAETIWNSQPSGILSYGNTSVNIIDQEGYTQEIQFSRPENVYIWLNATYTTDGSEPSDLNDQLKENMLEVANANFDIGDDVLYHILYDAFGMEESILTVPTLYIAYSTSLTPAPSFPGDYIQTNVSISRTQQASFAADRMTFAKV